MAEATGETRAERLDADTYEVLAPDLTRFATGLVGASHAADVVSSAMVKSLGAASWQDVVNRRAYLYRAVYHEAVTWKRRSKQRIERETRAAGRPTSDLPSFRPDVRHAVDRLSVRQRAVILLTYWADLAPQTVADHLGISEGAVRRHLARARASLRKVLDA